MRQQLVGFPYSGAHLGTLITPTGGCSHRCGASTPEIPQFTSLARWLDHSSEGTIFLTRRRTVLAPSVIPAPEPERYTGSFPRLGRSDCVQDNCPNARRGQGSLSFVAGLYTSLAAGNGCRDSALPVIVAVPFCCPRASGSTPKSWVMTHHTLSRPAGQHSAQGTVRLGLRREALTLPVAAVKQCNELRAVLRLAGAIEQLGVVKGHRSCERWQANRRCVWVEAQSLCASSPGAAPEHFSVDPA